MRRERLSLGSRADREELAQALLRAHDRPATWCVLDWASEATAALTDLLAMSWGPGLCYQPGTPWADPTRSAVLPRAAASRILRAAKTRVWWSESAIPDEPHVMESLEHGCLPLQFMANARAEGEAELSDATRALLLHTDRLGAVERLSEDELKSRIKTVAIALAKGQLELDLSSRSA